MGQADNLRIDGRANHETGTGLECCVDIPERTDVDSANKGIGFGRHSRPDRVSGPGSRAKREPDDR